MKSGKTATTFGFKLVDDKGLKVYDTDTKATNILKECTHIPLKGIYTMTVYSSSLGTDTYTGKLMIQEKCFVL